MLPANPKIHIFVPPHLFFVSKFRNRAAIRPELIHVKPKEDRNIKMITGYCASSTECSDHSLRKVQ